MTRNARHTPDQLQASIALVKATLDRIALDLKECANDIAERGLFVDATVLDSHRKPVQTRRPSIYLRAQRELMKSQKSLTAYLRTLEQELEAATATQQQCTVNEWAQL